MERLKAKRSGKTTTRGLPGRAKQTKKHCLGGGRVAGSDNTNRQVITVRKEKAWKRCRRTKVCGTRTGDDGRGYDGGNGGEPQTFRKTFRVLGGIFLGAEGMPMYPRRSISSQGEKKEESAEKGEKACGRTKRMGGELLVTRKSNESRKEKEEELPPEW